MNSKKVKNGIVFLLCISYCLGCSPTITTYDQYSYTQNSTLKVDVLNLIEKSSSDFSTYEKDIKDVLIKVEKAKEYDCHKPKNEMIAKMRQKS